MFVVAAVCLWAAASAPAAGWWNLHWPYRRAIEIPNTKRLPLEGEEVAVVTMPTAGTTQPGAATQPSPRPRDPKPPPQRARSTYRANAPPQPEWAPID